VRKMASGRSSRASSSHDGDARQNLDTIERIEIEDEGYDQEPLPTFTQDYQFTAEHPIGSILLSLVKDNINLARKTNLKSMNTNVADLCTEFRRGMNLERAENRSDIKYLTSQIEGNIIAKELNSHKINTAIDPPTYFSPVPTLHTSGKLVEVLKVFPRPGRFSGSTKDGGMAVTEFLIMLKEAQARCKLSEEEFISRMLASSTGLAHDLILEWKVNGENADTIFHNLMLNFDRRLSPDEAKIQLNAFKVNKNGTLSYAQSKIMKLAGRAASALPEGESRTAYYNMEAVNALIRALPQHSSQEVSNLYHNLTARLGKACTFSDLNKALNAYRVSIDRDIKQSGRDEMKVRKTGNIRGNFRPKFSTYNLTTSNSSAGINRNVSATDKANKPSGSAPFNRRLASNRYAPRNNVRTPFRGQGQRFRGNSRTGRGAYNRFGNSNNYVPKCSLCGVPGHKPAQCTNMRDNTGKILNIMPMLGVCTRCPKYIYPRLHHQEHICPYRPGGPLEKKSTPATN